MRLVRFKYPISSLTDFFYVTDLIFKNQAMNVKDKQGGHFVNDLLRTEFHKYVTYSHSTSV